MALRGALPKTFFDRHGTHSRKYIFAWRRATDAFPSGHVLSALIQLSIANS